MTKVTISRYWGRPEITTTVTDQSIELEISLDDFMDAVKKEYGPVWSTMTKDAFSLKLDSVKNSIISKIKQESNKVIQ